MMLLMMMMMMTTLSRGNMIFGDDMEVVAGMLERKGEYFAEFMKKKIDVLRRRYLLNLQNIHPFGKDDQSAANAKDGHCCQTAHIPPHTGILSQAVRGLCL